MTVVARVPAIELETKDSLQNPSFQSKTTTVMSRNDRMMRIVARADLYVWQQSKDYFG
jgi:hypothetical protein